MYLYTCPCLITQKEAKEFLEKEWNAQFWSRTTSLTEEEYFDDEENWARAMQHGYDTVNTARGFPPKKTEEDEEDDEDDEDDEDEDQEVKADGPTIPAKPKTAAKTEVDLSQVRIVRVTVRRVLQIRPLHEVRCTEKCTTVGSKCPDIVHVFYEILSR